MDKTFNFFVIMPIGDEKTNTEHYHHFKSVYDGMIIPSIEAACKNLSVAPSVMRADDISKSGAVMKQVITKLADDPIIIADLSSQNPNVFYELGIRHTLRKRSILLFDGKGKIPFDIKPYRAILYQFPFTAEFKAKFNNRMTVAIQEIIQNPTSSDNPVWDYLGSDIAIGPKPNGEILISFKRDKSVSDGNSHIYFLNLGVTNSGDKAFTTIHAELLFPTEYLRRSNTNYDFLTFEDERINELSYTKIKFTFDALPDMERRRQSGQLLPGNTMWIFNSDGKKAAYVLSYGVNNDNFWNIRKYKVFWKIFLDGCKPIEGACNFKELQEF